MFLRTKRPRIRVAADFDKKVNPTQVVRTQARLSQEYVDSLLIFTKTLGDKKTTDWLYRPTGSLLRKKEKIKGACPPLR